MERSSMTSKIRRICTGGHSGFYFDLLFPGQDCALSGASSWVKGFSCRLHNSLLGCVKFSLLFLESATPYGGKVN